MLETITEFLKEQGCTFPKIGLLQPADPFLDTTGEDLRRRIFMTQDRAGKLMCLRPEFTIPVCLHHLENGNGVARYAYGGEVFRQRTTGAPEFIQAGFESIGSKDKPSADAECIIVASGLIEHSGIANTSTVVGDQAVFVALIDALDIPQAWRKKLLRAFGDNALLAGQLDAMNENGAGENGLPDEMANAVAAADEARVLQLVTDSMLEAGLPLSGGRTPSAITERLIDQGKLRNSKLPDEVRSALDAFLKLEVPLAKAPETMEAFQKDFGVVLPGAVERLKELAGGLQDAAARCAYRASFGRRLDYYTGLVFEIYREGLDLPLIGGGRYDKLVTLLGAEEELPAVGFAVWVDRLEDSQ